MPELYAGQISMTRPDPTRQVADPYTRYLGDLCVQQGFFGVALLKGVRKILPRPTPVAMATKFETKSARPV